MGTLFVDLAVPAADGVGANVDVSLMGQSKTITYNGTLVGSVTIEVAVDAGGVAFFPIHTFTGPASVTLEVAARWMRTRVSGFAAGAGNVDVGANDNGTSFATLPAPAADGVGAQIDVSALGGFVTAAATGAYTGALHIEISEDGVDWSDVFSFTSASGGKSGRLVARFMRVRRAGVQGGVLPAVNVCAANDATDRNVTPIDGAGALNNIFVRSTGSDADGNGRTVATAYRTLRRALQDVPSFIVNEQYVIDCTGMGVETSADTLNIGPYLSGDGIILNFAPDVPGGLIEGPLTIQAVPDIDVTVPVADRTGTAAQATTGLLTYTTNVDMGALDAQRGRFLWSTPDATFRVAVVTGNTAGPNSDASVTSQLAVAAGSDLVIGRPSATINTTSVGDPALAVRNNGCVTVIQGLGFTTAGANNAVAVEGMSARVRFLLCQMEGVFMFGSSHIPGLAACFIDGGDLTFGGGGPQISLSLFRLITTWDIRNVGSGADAMTFSSCVFDTCAPVGSSFVDRANTWSIKLSNCEIKFATGDGFFCPPGGVGELEDCQVHDSVGNAVTVDAGFMSLTNVDSSVGGANAGLGILATNGAVVRARATTSVSGTGGDYQCGGNVAGAYPVPAGRETDLAAVAPQLCMIYN